MTSSDSMGLRERKKAKTREAIQQHALRLFRTQGYAATTVDQIAAAAEISPSTFFRYFPTKEETVFFDPLDPVLIDIARRQPAELSPIQALRATLNAIRGALNPGDWERERERHRVIVGEPELRKAVLEHLEESTQLLAGLAAERTGRAEDDFETLNWAAAVAGAAVTAFLRYGGDESVDYLEVLDRVAAHLEDGLPL